MKIKSGLKLKRILDTYVVLDMNDGADEALKLTDTAGDIWAMAEEGKSISEMAKSLANSYEVSQEEAENDIIVFCENMKELGYFYE